MKFWKRKTQPQSSGRMPTPEEQVALNKLAEALNDMGKALEKLDSNLDSLENEIKRIIK